MDDPIVTRQWKLFNASGFGPEEKTYMKTCRKWCEIKRIEATCPNCGHKREYLGPFLPGGIVSCKRCGGKFKLGKRK